MTAITVIRINNKNTCTNQSQLILTNLVYNFLYCLNGDYPNFGQWFFDKVINGFNNGTREILVASSSDNIVGVAILKKSPNEKKICTLRVHEHHQRNGIGSLLITEAIRILDTETPIITVASFRSKQFMPLFNKFGFKLTEICVNYYGKGTAEYAYNGLLNKYEIPSPSSPQELISPYSEIVRLTTATNFVISSGLASQTDIPNLSATMRA